MEEAEAFYLLLSMFRQSGGSFDTSCCHLLATGLAARIHAESFPMLRWRLFRFARLLRFDLGLSVLAFTFSAFSQQPGSAALLGKVFDSLGNPVADAVLSLGSKDSSETISAHTDSRGIYNFNGLHEGVYALRVGKSGYADTEVSSIFLAPKQTKNLDLVLGASKTSQSTVSKPQFFDQPQFTVSGVTDTTNLGGHGSDTVVRTRETLVKETIALGKIPATGSGGGGAAADPNSLKDTVAHVRALLAEHDLPELHDQLGDLEERLGDPLEAVHQYQRAAEMRPTEPYLFDWGAELLLHHAPEPAIDVFSNGARLFPHSARILLGLGAAWFTRGNNDEAVRRVCKASDLNPKDPLPYLFLGKMLPAQNVPSDEVIRRLQRFVTLQPRNADANYYYAVALGTLRDRPQDHDKDGTAQRESLLNTALRLNPDYAAAHLQLGMLHADQGKDATALSDYRQAIQLDPQLEQAHFRLAQAYRRLGEADEAAEELRIYEKLTKESAQTTERGRHEIRQFLYTLRDQTPAP